jgi:hypothetical protein
MIIWLIAFILFLYSEIKAVLVARDQDFRKKLIEDVSPAPSSPISCLVRMASPLAKTCKDAASSVQWRTQLVPRQKAVRRREDVWPHARRFPVHVEGEGVSDAARCTGSSRRSFPCTPEKK